MNRVGHAFFKRRMRETNAIFGGEVTGHYYFRDNFYADNGFIPALLILELMSKKGQSLRELLEPLRRALLHLRRDQHQAAEHGRRAGEARRRSPRKYADGHQYTLDGISVEYPDWHFNVRPSNTEPLLRLNLEATTPELMEREARRGARADSRVITGNRVIGNRNRLRIDAVNRHRLPITRLLDARFGSRRA